MQVDVAGLDEAGGGGRLGMQIGNCDFWPEQGAGEMMGDTMHPYTIGIA